MNVAPQEYTATVTNKEYLSPKVVLIKATPNRELDFSPGQYASLFVGKDIQRLYSFSSPDSSPYVEFIIDLAPNGPGSNYVKNLKEQDTIRFLSPFGHFTLNLASSKPLLFIATGTGIAPLKCHIDHLMANNTARDITLIFGNKNEQHLILDDKFLALSRKYENFTYLPVCSEPSPTWGKDRGLVTEVLLNKIPNPIKYDIYVCGNGPMVLTTMTLLRENNVPDNQIHIENYT